MISDAEMVPVGWWEGSESRSTDWGWWYRRTEEGDNQRGTVELERAKRKVARGAKVKLH